MIYNRVLLNRCIAGRNVNIESLQMRAYSSHFVQATNTLSCWRRAFADCSVFWTIRRLLKTLDAIERLIYDETYVLNKLYVIWLALAKA